MNRFVPALVALALVVATPAPAADKKDADHCGQLMTILQQAVDKIIKGDFSARVQIALDAHMRLGCDPHGLLDVLKIKRPKKTDGPS